MLFPWFFRKPCPCKNNYELIVLKNGKEIERINLVVGDHYSFHVEHNSTCPEYVNDKTL